jgi:hypothetical protein
LLPLLAFRRLRPFSLVIGSVPLRLRHA